VLLVLFAFGVGLTNFASGRHLTPTDVVDAIADELPVVASCGSTGNDALEKGNIDEIRRILERVTGTAWAGGQRRASRRQLSALSAMPVPTPTQPKNERSTPDLAFAFKPTRDGGLDSTSRAILHRLSADLVAVWKARSAGRSKARPRSTARRLGRGFGRHRPPGRGRWTARSRRTLDGLRSRV
jgi:hypothetical protein